VPDNFSKITKSTSAEIKKDQVETELFGKLRSLIIARLIIGSTLLLGTAIPLEVSGIYSTTRILFPLITAILVLTIIYSGLLNFLNNLVILAYIQLFGDVFLETIILMATGGIESPFSILYVLTIIVASYLIPRKGAFVTSCVISLIFGSVALCQHHGWTSWWPVLKTPLIFLPPSFAIYVIFVNLIGFVLTAFLANNLSERIRKINRLLTNRNVQYSYLWSLNKRIVSEMPSGLITATQDGYIISMNPSAERMLIVDDNENSRSRLDQILPSYLVQSILDIIKSAGSKQEAIHFEKEWGDDAHWIHMEVLPLTPKTQDPARIMIMLNDITDQKRLEDARRKAERWSTLAEVSAGMAHEIRNPLASISGSVEVLREQVELSKSGVKLMNIVIKETERLNNLISDFLDMSRPRPPEFQKVEIYKLINEMIVLLTSSASWSDQITIKLGDVDEDLNIELDSNQFLQLAWNLAKNAVEAMPSGGILTITYAVKEEPPWDTRRMKRKQPIPPPFLHLAFSDTGVGMSESVIDKIFDPFTTFKRQGVGIGLAIVYRIIENHNGLITVRSSLNEGTTFDILLPLVQNEKVEQLKS